VRDRAAAASEGKPVNPLDGYIGFHLRVAQEAYFDAFRRRTGAEELRSGLFAILAIVEANPGINQTTLGQINNRQKSTLTTSLRILEKQGLVRRRRSAADRRNYSLELTDAGREKLKAFWVHARAAEAAVVDMIGEDRRRELLETLTRIESLG
jgi:DNA-binding MarR family transcriptional regulator